MENEEDPLLEHEEKDDDEEGDTTNPFQPGGSSTPGEDIPMTTMNREKEKGSGIAETSFIEGSPLSRVLTSNAKAWESLTGMLPRCEGHRTRGNLQQNREVTSQNVWSRQEGLSFVYKRQRYRRTKDKSNSPERNKIFLDQSAKF